MLNQVSGGGGGGEGCLVVSEPIGVQQHVKESRQFMRK